MQLVYRAVLRGGIDIVTGEDSQSEWMTRGESNRVYWFQIRFLSLVYL